MSTRTDFRSRRPRGLRSLLVAALLAISGSALAAAPGVPDDLLANRRAEAALKARAAAKAAAAMRAATPNQGEFDVVHYDLDLTLDPAAHRLDGVVGVTVRVDAAALDVVDLDLNAGMTVDGATAGGAAVGWTRNGDVLTVDLDRTYAASELATVAVAYHGDPSGDYFGWDSYNGEPMIWSLSEPYGARDWWPCKDLNTDKADSVDVRVTVPTGLIDASNGLLVSETDNGGTHTFHWRTRYPISTYLVSIAVYPYTRFSDWYAPLAGGPPMELQFFVYPTHYTSVQTNYALTKDMIGTYAQAFGEYPFLDEKYGHAEFVWGGGMEHQTLTSLGGYSEDLISHELAHQWWGDMVTCADFHHVWLNEGFATWCEAYWAEQRYGGSTYRAYMDAAAYYGAGTIYVEDTSDFWGIFDTDLSYNKASWVVHMLRGALGDTDFFAGLAAYRQQYAYSTATTEQLRDVMEQVSGKDLHAFFQQWIYGEYFPVYDYDWVVTDHASGKIVHLVVKQVQTNTGLFTMPIPFHIATSGGDVDTSVWNDSALQSYEIPVPGTVTSVTMDPDRWILCRKYHTTLIATAAPDVPGAPRLLGVAPNPFNPAAEVRFSLPAAGRVEVDVFDAAGRRVRSLESGDMTAGAHAVVWRGDDADGRPAASGTYFFRLRTPAGDDVRPAALVR